MKKSVFLLFVLMLQPVMASAFEGKVEIKGICYHIITKGKKAEVVNLTNRKYLGNVIIPSTVSYDGVVCDVTRIGDEAFYRCTGLTSVTIPNSVTRIGDKAFAYCTKLTSVKIPNSVTSIGWGAFGECSRLTSITIPNSVTCIREVTFAFCRNLTSVKIPNSVTSIEQKAFYQCISLKSITIPNSVKTIGESAFESCSGLTSVKIPNSVTWIGFYAFANCKGLTTVTIPNSVTRIVEKAFSGCSDLTDVYCYIENLSNADVDSWAFVNSYLEYTTLHVPKASLEAYKKNEPWRGFGKIVTIERSVGIESDDVKSISGKKLEAVNENIKFKIESESNVETTESEILTLKSIVENTSEYAESNSKVFDVVDQMPSFPGGPSAMIQYLSKNQQYPVDAEKNGIQGRVIVTFVVECDGSITNVRVVKSVDPSLDKEAIRVVKSMPLWIPGKQNGSAVRVKYTVPVTFRLQ